MRVFSKRSIEALRGVHPDLVAVVRRSLALSVYDFTVTEGVRSLERQRELLAKKATMTLNSKHRLQADGFGHAVDVMAVGDLNADGVVDHRDKSLTWSVELYTGIAAAMERSARELGIAIRWGGRFTTWKGEPYFDGPHFELS